MNLEDSRLDRVDPQEAGDSDVVGKHLAHVVRGGALNLAGAVMSAASGFLLVVIVANHYSEQQAGLLFATVSAFLIVTAAASLGTDTGLARFVLPLMSRGHRDAVRSLISAALRPVMVTAVAISLVALLAAGPLSHLMGLDRQAGATFVRVFAIALPFATLGDFWLGCTRAFGRMRPTVALDNLLRSGLQVALVALAGFLGLGSEALGAGWAAPYVLMGLGAALIGARMLRERTAERPTDRAPQPKENDAGVSRGEFWRYTAPRAVARVSQIALQRLDIVIVAVVLGAPDAAVYTAATRFVVLGQFASQAIQRVLQPRFSQMIELGDMATVREVFEKSTAWGIALSWPVYAIAAGAAPSYLGLFGEGYATDAVPVVIIMALAMMMAIAAGPLDTLLLMAGKSSISLTITIAALAIDVAGCLILLPTMGITGAALAWAIAVVARNLATYVVVRRFASVSPVSKGSVIAATASLLTIALPLGIMSATTDPTTLELLVCTAAGLSVYGLVLYLARDALALSSLRALLPQRFR